MQVPVSVMILLVVVIGVVGVVVYNYVSKAPGFEPLPIKASYPSGNPVYRINNTFIIPVRFSTSSSDRAFGLCRIGINYLTPTSQSVSTTVVLALSKTVYRTSAVFPDGTISIPVVVIRHPVDTQITIVFNGTGYKLNSIVLYYCEYGVSTKPRWSESLLIPETVLSP